MRAAALLFEPGGRAAQIFILHIAAQHAVGRDHPKALGVGDGAAGRFVFKNIRHEIFREVIPRRRDVITRAALAGVHLKQLVGPGARVALHIKVGKANPVHILQKGAQLAEQRSVVDLRPGQDPRIVADALGGLFLQQRPAEREQPNFAVQPTVGVEHPHTAVIAGDVLLQNQVVLVFAAINRRGDRIKILAVFGQEHLFLVREMAVPVGHRVARLDDNREIEREFGGLIILRRAGRGARMVKSVGVAGAVEVILDIEREHRIKVGAGKTEVWRKGLAVAGQQDCVAIRAGDKHKRGAGVGLRIVEQGRDEDLVLLELRLNFGDAHKLCVAAGDKHRLADHIADDAVGCIKAAGHAIDVGIAAEQHGLKVLHANLPASG